MACKLVQISQIHCVDDGAIPEQEEHQAQYHETYPSWQTYEDRRRCCAWQGKKLITVNVGDEIAVYEGDWVLGKRHGSGWLSIGKIKYVGEWKNDLPDGRGTACYGDGTFYTGEWSQGKYWGRGVLVTPERKTLSGFWVDGRFQETGYLHMDPINLN